MIEDQKSFAMEAIGSRDALAGSSTRVSAPIPMMNNLGVQKQCCATSRTSQKTTLPGGRTIR